MTDPNLLRANVASLSPLVTDNNVSAWLPQAPQAIADFLRDTKYLSPQNVSGFGQTNRFELTKQGTSLMGVTIRSVFSAIPITSGTFVRYMDFIGIAQFKELRVLYVGNLIFKYGKEYMFVRIRKWLTDEKRDAINQAIYGEQTPAQRSALTQAGFDTYTPAMWPNSYATDQATPIVTLSQKLNFEFDSDTIVNLLQTDGTITAYDLTINTVTYTILPDYIHTIESDTQFLVAKSKEENGIPYLLSNKTYIQKINVSAAPLIDQFTEFRMLNRGVVKGVYFYLVALRLLQTPGSNEYFEISNNPVPANPLLTAYDPIDHFEMEANGVFAIRGVNRDRFNRFIIHPFYHSSRPGDNIFFWSWSLTPETENAAFGNLAFANLDNPILRIWWGPSGTGFDPVTGDPNLQVLVLHILYFVYTYIQFQGGDVTEVFV